MFSFNCGFDFLNIMHSAMVSKHASKDFLNKAELQISLFHIR